MALSQRPAGRFFSAFYRWSCYTQRSVTCKHVAYHRRAGLQHLDSYRSLRGYLTTKPCRQSESTVTRTNEEYAPSAAEIATDDNQARLEEAVAGQSEDIEPTEELVEDEEINAEEVEFPPDYSLARVGAKEMRNGVRNLMRHVPSSVAIITAASTDPETKQPVPLGIAISSLNTVTLDPPHVSFNIKYPSKTLDAIRAANGLFRVHFLSCREKSGQIAENFTRGNHANAYKMRKRLMPIFTTLNRDHPDAASSLAPQIRDSTVVAAMECELTQEVSVADHIVAVAKVNSLESKSDLESTLLYHDGNYKRNDGTILRRHRNDAAYSKSLSTQSGIYWRYSLFPGEAERQDFKERIKEHIKNKPHYLDMETFKASKALQDELGIPSGALGINLWHLIAECRVDLGCDAGLDAFGKDTQLMADFWGRLTPSDIAAIVERAKKLVYLDPMSLTLHYKTFFAYLGVHTVSTGLLASDILEPLREEGLVAPFEPRTTSRSREPGFKPSIEDLEDVEYKLRDFMKTRSYEQAHRMTAEEMERAIGEKGWVDTYIKRIRGRITIEAYPESFSPAHIDISGQVSREEARVVVSRIINYLDIGNPHALRKNISLPKTEFLRRIGVHPMISGIDPDFLFGKVGYMLHQAQIFREFPEAVDKMLKPWFAMKTFDYVELEARVRNIVQKHTLHAVKWSLVDLLAAMGVDHRSKIKTPLSLNKPRILHGHILPVLFAKELRNRYGKGTPEENEAIATYLKAEYNYDVPPPAPSSHPLLPLEVDQLAAKGSDEEMHDAMMQNLNVHVLPNSKAKQELEEAIQLFKARPTKFGDGRKIQGTTPEDRERWRDKKKRDWTMRRIKISHSEPTWKAYRLDGDK